MDISEARIARLRKSVYRQFVRMSRGRGSDLCTYYPASSGTTDVVKRNLYHDIIEDTGPSKVDPIAVIAHVSLTPPQKVIKSLGWYVEGEQLPILCYFPYIASFEPEKKAKLVISGGAYIAGTWVVEKVMMYGRGTPVAWVCHVTKDRETDIRVGI